LGFQAIFGYVYHELAILIALFMTGMALGSWWRLRVARSARSLTPRAGLMRLAALQILAAMFPVLLYLFFSFLTGIRSSGLLVFVSQIIFPALALLAGVLGGYGFGLATEVFFAGSPVPQASMGMLYGVDLLGACLGTLLLSAFLLPLFGFLKAAIFIAVVNLVPTLLAVWVGRSKLEPQA
jgi:spermidine synthase